MTTPANRPVEDVVVALDMSGDRIKAVVMAVDGTVVHTTDADAGMSGGPDEVVDNVLALAGALTERHGAVAAGIAVPGVVNEPAGICAFAARLGWRDLPLQQWAEEELGIPVALGNDVRAGGLAEARLGAGRGCRSSLYVSADVGIAAALLLDGRTLIGGHGGAGELGHLVVRPDGEPCDCGNRGCLETLASAATIAHRYRLATGQATTVEEVALRSDAGDAEATAIWREAVEALADGLAAGVTLLDPRRIVVDGELARTGRLLFAPLRAALAERLTFQTLPQVVPAALGPRAASIGAGLLALDLWNAHRSARPVRPRLYAVGGDPVPRPHPASA